MEDPNSANLLWDVHGMRAEALKEEQTHVWISSCSLLLQCMEETEWILFLFISCDDLFVLIKRKSCGKTERIELEYDIHLLTRDGSIWRKCEKKKKVFQKGHTDILTLASRQDLLDNSKALMDRGVVRVSVRLWPVGSSLPHSRSFCFKSRAGVPRRVLWNVKQVSKMLGGEEREYTLDKLGNLEGVSKIILFLKEGNVCMRIKSSLIDNHVILCESICIIQNEDSLKSRLQCWGGCKLLKNNDCNFYLAFIEAERLTTYLSANKDELTFFFQFIDYSTLPEFPCSEVIGAGICSIETPTNEVSTIDKATNTTPPVSDALQTQSRGVNTDDSLERGHPDCPIGSDFQSLLQDATLSDFQLKAGHDSIAVHKAVLCARSPVLKAMLEAPMRESCDNEMDVPDFKPDTVRRLVHFLYSGCVPDLDQSTALELYEAADKYAVFTLRALCSRAMVSGLDVSNVCEVLSLSDRHQDAELKGKAMDYIQTNKQQVFMSGEWISFMKDQPILALEAIYNLEVKKYSS